MELKGFGMKYVIAIIKPHKRRRARSARRHRRCRDDEPARSRASGGRRGQTEIYRGAEYATNMVPKVKVEIALADSLADQAVEAIREAANMGSIGDGKIFVLDLESALRIRTGETGETAL